MSDTTTPAHEQRDRQDPSPVPRSPFKNVLCAVDGSRRSFNAVEQAATLLCGGGQLTVMTVTALAGTGAYRTAAISPPRAERIVARAAALARRAGVTVRSEIDPSAPADLAILERAREHDLLAIGAPAGLLGGFFTDGVALATLKSLSTPLLLSRPLPRGERTIARHMLVASDGLEASDAVVDLAAQLAPLLSEQVVLVHAIGVESQSHPQRVRRQGSALAAAMQAGVCEVLIEPGGGAEVVLQTARTAHTSLIVAGTRRLHGLRALGSVSRDLVSDAHASVLLVPPGPQSS